MCAFGDERLPDRFWAKVAVNAETGCWEWTGAMTPSGYGNTSFGRRETTSSHRAAYQRLVGPIPDGLEIDHLCRNRACCNPAHLEPVTRKENLNRGLIAEVQRQRHAAVTHCPRGHEYTDENTYYPPRKLYRNRMCRTCRRERQATPEHKAYMRAYRARVAAQARDAA